MRMMAEILDSGGEGISRHYKVTLLFNGHHGAAQAQQTLLAIPDEAIVFSEGSMLRHDYARQRLHTLRSIAERRLYAGYYDQPTAQEFASAADVFLNRQGEDKGHDEHSYQLFRGLFEKNCVVLPADFLNLVDEDLSRFDPYFNPQPPPYIEEGNVLREAVRYARASRRVAETRYAWYDYREAWAVRWVQGFLTQFAERNMLGHVYREADGRAGAYVVFGSAHSNALTEKFQAAGMPVETIVQDIGQRTPEEEWSVQLRTMPRKEYMRHATLHHLAEFMAYEIGNENYEQAAELRDLIQDIKAKM